MFCEIGVVRYKGQGWMELCHPGTTCSFGGAAPYVCGAAASGRQGRTRKVVTEENSSSPPAHRKSRRVFLVSDKSKPTVQLCWKMQCCFCPLVIQTAYRDVFTRRNANTRIPVLNSVAGTGCCCHGASRTVVRGICSGWSDRVWSIVIF